MNIYLLHHVTGIGGKLVTKTKCDGSPDKKHFFHVVHVI